MPLRDRKVWPIMVYEFFGQPKKWHYVGTFHEAFQCHFYRWQTNRAGIFATNLSGMVVEEKQRPSHRLSGLRA